MAWVIIGAVVGLLILFVAFRAQHYKRMFALDHYVEIARGLARIKAGALETLPRGDDVPPLTPEDARTLLTQPGLAVAYTINHEPVGYVHHYSLSVPGAITPSAVGTTFTIYLALLLGVEIERLTTKVSERGVYHTEFTLNADEQAAFVERPVTPPSAAEFPALQERCQSLRASLPVGALEMPQG